MGRYRLVIDCVDGETTFTLTTPHKNAVLAFLEKHDHEGSALSLETPTSGSCIFNNDVYLYLRQGSP